MTTLNINLTPDVMRIVRNHVDSGSFRDESDLISDAILKLDDDFEAPYKIRMERLREALAEGILQAEAGDHSPYSLEELNAEMDAESPE